LIDAHRGLSDEQSALLNAKLILLLANQIGDLEVLKARWLKQEQANSHESTTLLLQPRLLWLAAQYDCWY
jgi:hypothetical protein